MATERIFIEPFGEAGDAAYRVYASTRELLFAGCGLALSNLILPSVWEEAEILEPIAERSFAAGGTLVETRGAVSSASILNMVPGASPAERSFVLSSRDLDLLLVDFLNELIYLFDSEGFWGYSFEPKFADPKSKDPAGSVDAEMRLAVRTSGVILPPSALEPEQPEDGILGIVPKGVSYHMLEAGQGKDGRWHAQFVIDA
ncbi:MAG TPA: archease [Firmicutes bacterium]|nr:archease [Bacillota bacterium]